MPHSRRLRNRETHCGACGLPHGRCVCSLAPRLEIGTEFLIVSHAKEIVRTSNTARLARLAMPGTRILLRGVKGEPIPAGEFEREGTDFFLLYPSPEAREIGGEFRSGRSRPFVIVVPDGSWRQTARAVRREEGLRALPRLRLPPGPESRYALRTQPAAGLVSTFEAIARVVGILEGREKQEALEGFLDEMVRRNLVNRGELAEPGPISFSD